MFRNFLVIIVLLFSFLGYVKADEYKSPDGKYVAEVFPLKKTGESKIVIKTKAGRIIISKSYGSRDGQHGYIVKNAEWSPNSQFFVFSMISSGGHQPWHFPTDVFSVGKSKIKSLDGYLGPIIDPDFKLTKSDIIQTAVARGNDISKKKTVKIRLKKLFR